VDAFFQALKRERQGNFSSIFTSLRLHPVHLDKHSITMKIVAAMQCVFLSYLICSDAPTYSNQISANPILIDIDWSTIDFSVHTIPSLQIVANPLVSRQFSPIYEEIFTHLAQLQADFVRYAAWFPYPKMGVAELDPPSGLLQCRNVGENVFANLSCREGSGVISQIDFASYGTASGACGQMKEGSCHAARSLDLVKQICIGQAECRIPASSDLFGDPCE
jgi:hypothetical protein